MNKYEQMAKEATVTRAEQPPIHNTDKAEIKKLKKVPLWYFDFTQVEGAPCSLMGEHTKTEEEAIPLVAARLRELAGDANA